MAGAKETPRQKLISLMYLVFITMLALNVSKEVLDGFGQMFTKISTANTRVAASNESIYENIEINAKEKEGKWIVQDRVAKEIKVESDKFFNKIQEIKDQITEKQKLDVETEEWAKLDKGEELNMLWFKEGGDAASQEFIQMIQEYKGSVLRVFASRYPAYTEMVEERFFTGDENYQIETRDGTKQDWLKANFEGFPLISSLAKLTMMQNDVRQTEHDVLTTLMGKELKMSSAVNEDNYISLLKTEKGAYYQGEAFDGSVILGRKGGAQKPNAVEITLDGNPLTEDQYELIDGGIKLNVNAGRPGDHVLEGNLMFLNEGVESRISVNQSFAVIAKPNSAVISADKMNVVYRGVENPLTISIPGIADNKVRASAPGLKRLRGSKFIMNPGKGKEVSIRASGTLPDGQSVSSSTKFRIKDLPAPSGSVARQTGTVSIPKGNFLASRVGAVLLDFDFELPINVIGFTIQAPGAPAITVSGNRLNDRAKSLVNRTKSGSTVQIFDIKVRTPKNPNLRFKNPSPVIVKLI